MRSVRDSRLTGSCSMGPRLLDPIPATHAHHRRARTGACSGRRGPPSRPNSLAVLPPTRWSMCSEANARPTRRVSANNAEIAFGCSATPSDGRKNLFPLPLFPLSPACHRSRSSPVGANNLADAPLPALQGSACIPGGRQPSTNSTVYRRACRHHRCSSRRRRRGEGRAWCGDLSCHEGEAEQGGRSDARQRGSPTTLAAVL